ncbi:MAG: hypothetical protein IKW59_00255 [Clostridia bacterium]|nr:hypothetical protein [Clostridia bacterium]
MHSEIFKLAQMLNNVGHSVYDVPKNGTSETAVPYDFIMCLMFTMPQTIRTM